MLENADQEGTAILCINCIREIASFSDDKHSVQELRDALGRLQENSRNLFTAIIPEELKTFGTDEKELKRSSVLGKAYSSYSKFSLDWSLTILEVACEQIGIDLDNEMERLSGKQRLEEKPAIDGPVVPPSSLLTAFSEFPAEYQRAALANSNQKDALWGTVRKMFDRHFLVPIVQRAFEQVDYSQLPHFTFSVDAVESSHLATIVEAAQLGSVVRERDKPIVNASARAWHDSDFDLLLASLRSEKAPRMHAVVAANPAADTAENPNSADPLKVFVSYCHADEHLLSRLLPHLASLRNQGRIASWHDRKIIGGTEWKGQIDENLAAADAILILISSNFLDSKYCHDVEMRHALERHNRNDARIVPIFLRPCDWEHEPFAAIQGLPKDAKPVTRWSNRDLAYTDIAKGLRLIIDELYEARRSG